MATERMAGGDAAWLHMDRPTNLMIVNAVFWFDDPLDWDAVTTVLQERLVEVFPRFRQRVLDPSITLGEVSRPRWEDVAGFRAEDQIRRARLEGPDRDEALLQDGHHRIPVQRVVEPEHRVDDHEVGRPVHVQPGGVAPGHPLGHHRTLLRPAAPGSHYPLRVGDHRRHTRWTSSGSSSRRRSLGGSASRQPCHR